MFGQLARLRQHRRLGRSPACPAGLQGGAGEGRRPMHSLGPLAHTGRAASGISPAARCDRFGERRSNARRAVADPRRVARDPRAGCGVRVRPAPPGRPAPAPPRPAKARVTAPIGDVARRRRGDLQEHAAVRARPCRPGRWSAGTAGRTEAPWRGAWRRADRARMRSSRHGFALAVQLGEQGDVVALPAGAGEMRAEPGLERVSTPRRFRKASALTARCTAQRPARTQGLGRSAPLLIPAVSARALTLLASTSG